MLLAEFGVYLICFLGILDSHRIRFYHRSWHHGLLTLSAKCCGIDLLRLMLLLLDYSCLLVSEVLLVLLLVRGIVIMAIIQTLFSLQMSQT